MWLWHRRNLNWRWKPKTKASSSKTTRRHINVGFIEKTLFHHYVHFLCPLLLQRQVFTRLWSGLPPTTSANSSDLRAHLFVKTRKDGSVWGPLVKNLLYFKQQFYAPVFISLVCVCVFSLTILQLVFIEFWLYGYTWSDANKIQLISVQYFV